MSVGIQKEASEIGLGRKRRIIETMKRRPEPPQQKMRKRDP